MSYAVSADIYCHGVPVTEVFCDICGENYENIIGSPQGLPPDICPDCIEKLGKLSQQVLSQGQAAETRI